MSVSGISPSDQNAVLWTARRPFCLVSKAFRPVLGDGQGAGTLSVKPTNADLTGTNSHPRTTFRRSPSKKLLSWYCWASWAKVGQQLLLNLRTWFGTYLTMEEAGRERWRNGQDRDKRFMAYRNGYVHLHSRVGIAIDSLNKPWTEEQKHKVLLTTVGKKSLPAISCPESTILYRN